MSVGGGHLAEGAPHAKNRKSEGVVERAMGR